MNKISKKSKILLKYKKKYLSDNLMFILFYYYSYKNILISMHYYYFANFNFNL